MSNTNDPWFVAERSEALAGVLLTSRRDVRVRSERKHDSGPDFLVELDTGDPLSTRLFVVQVRGTTSSAPEDWMQNVKPLFREPGSPISLPVCVFVVNVRESKAFYAWVAEPQIEAKGSTLRFHETGLFSPLDPAAVSDIIDRVRAWYECPRNSCPREASGSGRVCSYGHRPIHKEAGGDREGGLVDEAGVDAVLQALELLRGPRRAHQGGPGRPDRRVRRAH